MITFVAGAVSYLRVQKTDNNVYTYILDKVGSINYEKTSTSDRFMRINKASKDGVEELHSVEKIAEIDCVDAIITEDTTDTKVQGVSVSGKINGYTYVDLGLPSGKLWATYNIGATSPLRKGDYFAWGETEPNAERNYCIETYKWSDDGKTMSKYCTDSTWGKVDNLKNLSLKDDAVAANWGSIWRLPKASEIYELLDGCEWSWETNYNRTGVSGELGKSKKNGKTIFFPAFTYIHGEVTFFGSACLYQTATLASDEPDKCGILFFTSDDGGTSIRERYWGYQARGIADPKEYFKVNFYGIDSTILSSHRVIEGVSLTAPEIPTVKKHHFVGWSDSSFCKVTKDLRVYAIYEAEPNIEGADVNGNAGGYHYVDLGLPSGLLWAAYNVGSTKPSEYGSHFAWGETTEKDTSLWANYKWCDGKSTNINKYCTEKYYGKVDGIDRLETEDDAANANWGDIWRMPTDMEQLELIKGCDWVYTDNYNNTGVAGCVGTSKTNDNVIFLPVNEEGNEMGTYWASNLPTNQPNYGYILTFGPKKDITWGNKDRVNKFAVRAVRTKQFRVNFYSSDSTLIESQLVEKGKGAIAPQAPNIEGPFKFSGWSRSFAEVVMDLDIYAKYKDSTIVNGVNVNGNVGGYTYVDLGLSVKWATYNVGANSPTKIGNYYAWGESTPRNIKYDEYYDWESYKWTTLNPHNNVSYDYLSKYNNDDWDGIVDNISVLEPEDDAATVNWGEDWRMPTMEELKELLNGCSWEKTSNFNGTGVGGFIGKSKTNNNIIFLPYTGYMDQKKLVSENECYYNSSSLYVHPATKTISAMTSSCLNLSSKNSISALYRYQGVCVRAVTK